MGADPFRSRLSGWLVGRVQRRPAAKRGSRTIDEFDVWDDVVGHVGDHRVYGSVVAVENGQLTVREFGGFTEHRVAPDVVDWL
jgi:hypothetical protein